MSDRMGAYISFKGPVTQPFKKEWQYQYATVGAGRYGQVYLLENPQPGLLVGVITQVANDWYPGTYLEWFVDYDQQRVDYVIADIENPRKYRGIPFSKEVKWVAYNQDVVSHTFGVLIDGLFMTREVYSLIVGEKRG